MQEPTLGADQTRRHDNDHHHPFAHRRIRPQGRLGHPRSDREPETPLPQIDETWVAANFTPAADRSEAQNARLAQSDALVAELQAADTIVIGLPVYNFGVPAALKAWIDLIARAGVTFRYTAEGPEGLLTGKKVIVAFASGGVQLGSDYDFASTYLRHVLGFVGLTDVSIITEQADAAQFAA